MSADGTRETIILEIDKALITVKKRLLITNSDYFKAMFGDGFIEKNKKVIEIKDVDLKAMNRIIKILSGAKLKDDDILIVLEAVCMLQFNNIKQRCVERMTVILSPKNCIPFWLISERLEIRPLWLKAKRFSLDEFEKVKDTDSLGHLTLPQLCSYLGHVNLKTESEKSVFEALMTWWCEHGNRYKEDPQEDTTKIILQMLSCVNYNKLSDIHMRDIIKNRYFADHLEIKEVLECLSQMHRGLAAIDYSEKCQEISKKLLSCRNRFLTSCPCFLFEYRHNEHGREYIFLYYDSKTNQFRKFIPVNRPKYDCLEGCKFIGHKQRVIMYGGEYLIGRGKWNFDLWVFDNKKEKWHKRRPLPFPRRHFETCIVGNKLYITGGTGNFRVNQENSFWYDIEKNRWSKQLRLPVNDRHVKCCCFCNKYFILSVSNKCGYYMDEDGSWEKIRLNIEDSLLKNQTDFALFNYENNLYIKGKDLIALSVSDKEITVSTVKNITNKDCEKMEITICEDTVYTLYKYNLDFKKSYSLETYHMKTGHIDYLFEDRADGYLVVDIDDEKYILSSSMKLFSFNHQSLVVHNEVINDSFMC